MGIGEAERRWPPRAPPLPAELPSGVYLRLSRSATLPPWASL